MELIGANQIFRLLRDLAVVLTIDIRPYIYEMHLDGEGVFMQLASPTDS